MSISEKQLEANRLNAQKSTGPKTLGGKAVVRNNAVKHGLHARDIIITSPRLTENPAEYEQLLRSLFDELHPATDFQESLVRKIANCLWRSRRAIIAETAVINRQITDLDKNPVYNTLVDNLKQIPDIPGPPDDADDMQKIRRAIDRSISNYIGVNSIPGDYHNNNILRYEMRLDRQMTRAYKLLSHLQSTQDAEILQDRYNEK